jgi:hypothetical protein
MRHSGRRLRSDGKPVAWKMRRLLHDYSGTRAGIDVEAVADAALLKSPQLTKDAAMKSMARWQSGKAYRASAALVMVAACFSWSGCSANPDLPNQGLRPRTTGSVATPDLTPSRPAAPPGTPSSPSLPAAPSVLPPQDIPSPGTVPVTPDPSPHEPAASREQPGQGAE